MRAFLILAAAVILSTASGRALADEYEAGGVTFEPTITVRGEGTEHELRCTGTALRKKFFFKVYVAGLYLPQKRSSAEQIFSADEPRRMELHFLRDVDKDSINDVAETIVDHPEGIVLGGRMGACGGTPASVGALYWDWWNSDGANGEEPPPDVLKSYELYEACKTAKSDEELKGYSEELFALNADQIWFIGVVGLLVLVVPDRQSVVAGEAVDLAGGRIIKNRQG